MSNLGVRDAPVGAPFARGPAVVSPAFDSPAGEAAYLAAYAANMKFWPVPYESLDVSSRFGRTHLVACGPEDAPPLVLLHGHSASLTMWWPNAADLGRDFRLFAIDVMGQPGKSVPADPITSRAEYVEWLTAVLDALHLDRVCMAGMSYGGWLTLNFAMAAPERLERIVLLSPAGAFLPLVDEFYRRGAAVAATATRDEAESFLRWTGPDDVPTDPRLLERYERLVDQFHLGNRHFRGAPPDASVMPVAFTDDELRSVRTPTLLLIGEHEAIYDPGAAIQRALRLIPTIEAELVPKAGHLMSYSRPAVVDTRVVKFLRER